MTKRKREKQVLINESAFVDVCKLVMRLEQYELDETTMTIKKRLEGQIKAKFDAMEKRRLFTEYKTAAVNSEIREKKRNEYLDKADILQEWRTNQETQI